jgi:hypothetical protein
VTVRTGCGVLRELRITRADNAALIPASPAVGAAATTFVVRRVSGVGAATVQAVVVDDCGQWPTFFGGGPDAWGN